MPTEVGRIKESFNPVTDSMAGVYAGIVDAEAKREGAFSREADSWWDSFASVKPFFPSVHSWPQLLENLYDSCNDGSPHPFCKSAALTNWTANFRNLPLQMPVRI